jgi:hypothetical protein
MIPRSKMDNRIAPGKRFRQPVPGADIDGVQ